MPRGRPRKNPLPDDDKKEDKKEKKKAPVLTDEFKTAADIEAENVIAIPRRSDGYLNVPQKVIITLANDYFKVLAAKGEAKVLSIADYATDMRLFYNGFDGSSMYVSIHGKSILSFIYHWRTERLELVHGTQEDLQNDFNEIGVLLIVE